ncbi:MULTISPECIES: bifunctional aspartate transaminase/aspartate 4-decarboxylase [unclassified Candidatus Frackibacter]|uniref:bifunctional aspartate transaminase/aspartate 4-decarboxylase n=2 Tax=Candidatus Frackibacter TaxID=2017975 RepID=UPI0008B67185|nr:MULTISPECIES: bifunctional aspartate transaminase/aspartate 4-decarboxylase [unclassified Candidatus Frackibacter]SEM75758.1 aspartate 4-decarboxylase [Candidatus Frackibacter sp. WG12]SFL86574.1 aspartate 4-decarboxylase [Candidatus Frackibacter sp. WG13]
METKDVLASGLTYEDEIRYMNLSPFEVTNILRKIAQDGCERLKAQGKDCRVLNAGRGNPNFLNIIGRKAFAKLMLFATELAANGQDLGWRPERRDIARKFKAYLAADRSKETFFLKEAIDYAEEEIGLDVDEFVFELVDAALGDFYPDPPRIYPNTGEIVRTYLDDILIADDKSKDKFDIFATEGATEAMVYSFKSLRRNHLLKADDRIATVTPIFAPYLEIPSLNDYDLVNIEIKQSEALEWQIPSEELKKLEDERIKVLYLVNPTNPTSVAISSNTIEKIAKLVRDQRQDLIILTDTVYATFVDNFYSLIDAIPENTLCIYSYSKYFGVTGWRLGVIMLNKDNVIDRLISELPNDVKEELNERYGIITPEPEKIKFIDRLEMDSREVALAHTGGLSGPQQAIMCIFSLFNLIDKERVYKSLVTETLERRIKNLYASFPEDYSYLKGSNKTHYYALINIAILAKERYNEEFANYLTENFLALDFLIKLAAEKAILCLPGAGFSGPEWTLRVSLANLNDQDYLIIGQAIIEVLDEYYDYYQGNE